MNNLEMSTVTAKSSLVLELKALIINAVNLHHIQSEEISPETPLGATGLNLDSVDILEVVVAVEHKYQVKVADAEVGRKYFGSIGGIADFIMDQRS